MRELGGQDEGAPIGESAYKPTSATSHGLPVRAAMVPRPQRRSVSCPANVSSFILVVNMWSGWDPSHAPTQTLTARSPSAACTVVCSPSVISRGERRMAREHSVTTGKAITMQQNARTQMRRPKMARRTTLATASSAPW